MAGGTVPSGQTTWNGTLATGVADVVVFADRYNYVAVSNNTVSNPIYVSTDGSTPNDTGTGASDFVTVNPGATVVVGNQSAYWGQADKVTVTGTVAYPNGSGAYQSAPNGNPGKVHPFGSTLSGRASNPGTTIKLISAGANTYTVSAVG